jgi:hypothetical protein
MQRSAASLWLEFMVTSQKSGVWGVLGGLCPAKTPHFPLRIEKYLFMIILVEVRQYVI